MLDFLQDAYFWLSSPVKFNGRNTNELQVNSKIIGHGLRTIRGRMLCRSLAEYAVLSVICMVYSYLFCGFKRHRYPNKCDNSSLDYWSQCAWVSGTCIRVFGTLCYILMKTVYITYKCSFCYSLLKHSTNS